MPCFVYSSRMEETFSRPVPTIGDTTSAQARASDPRAWAMDPATRQHLYDVIDARRDIRRFRPDPVDEPTLERLLTAAHHGPSVGHSQPWRFIVITSDATRARAAVMADQCRVRQASLLEESAARNLLDLQLEGIREAPIGVVVACDRRVPHKGVLGRATFADSDMWSCASAIENLWLAARAEGLGMGWVTLFEPEELADLLGLPEGVETLGWLCLGWPDERPPSPGLERRGWSKRLPLEDVILYERWPDTDLTPPAHRLREGAVADPVSASASQPIPAATRALSQSPCQAVPTPSPHIADPPSVSSPDQADVVHARDLADNLLTPPGSLGQIDQVLDRVNAISPTATSTGCLVLVGADHGVTDHHISAFEPYVTRDVMKASIQGAGLGTALAKANGFESIVVDAGVREAIEGAVSVFPDDDRGDILNTDALSLADVHKLIEGGKEIGRDVSAQMVCLGEVGVGNTTVASALAALLLGLDAKRCIGLGAGADTAMTERKLKVVEAACARATEKTDGVRTTYQIGYPYAPSTHPYGHLSTYEVLSIAGGPEFCLLTGVILGAAEAGKVIILDGLATTIPAIIAQRIDPGAQSHLVASHRSRETVHGLALAELGLEPVGDWRLRAGEGAGAVMVAGMLNRVHIARTLTARTTDPLLKPTN